MSTRRIELAIEFVRDALSLLTPEERVAVLERVSEPTDVESALRLARGNVSRAARIMGVSRTTVRMHKQKLGLPPGKAGRPPKVT